MRGHPGRTCRGSRALSTAYANPHIVIVAGLMLAACVATEPANRRIVVATTTSVEDSGLLDVLVPAFERDNPGWSIQYTAVGSGQALELGRRRDVDAILAHSPADELRFMADGHGADRRAVMHNEFLLLGPAADPAGIRGGDDAAAALRAIARDSAPFISRGDDSGTHRRELDLWQAAGIDPAGDWYVEAGVGMGDALRIASERQAYILSDVATYLNARAMLDLDIVCSGDERLLNAYSIITVADAASAEGAVRLADWLTGPAAQATIAEFGVATLGQPLFVPDALPAAVR